MLDTPSPLPLYHRLLVVLRQRIAEGGYGPGGALLPTEKQLEAEFGVSRITVRRAMEALQADGLIRRRAGRGTEVAMAVQADGELTTSVGPFENLIHMGLATEVTLLAFEYVAARPSVARRLGIEAGEEVQRAVRVRSADGRPFSHLTTWVPAPIGRAFERDALASEPLLVLLERAGGRPERAEQTFTAVAAEPDAARALNVPIAAPLLSIERIVRDAGGRPVELLAALYRPDRYRYVSTLSRNTAPDGPVWLTDPERRP